MVGVLVLLGALLIMAGAIVSLTGIGLVVGVPMIVLGAIVMLLGGGVKMLSWMVPSKNPPEESRHRQK